MNKTTNTTNTAYYTYVTRNGNGYQPHIISVTDGDASTSKFVVSLAVTFNDYESAYAACEEVKPQIVNG